MSSMVLAQILMGITLVLMITGLTPLYTTAILGSAIAAIAAGFPLSGSASVTVAKLINSGLNPVIADMCGVLLFIGVMQAAGFLDVIIKAIIRVGRKMGGGPGVATAGGIAAGVIGALTGFTQPVITGVITGPAAIKLGVDPNKAAGITAHGGHFGNFAGFTHPTQVALIAAAGIGFGAINVAGAIVALTIFAVSYFRLQRSMKADGSVLSQEQMESIAAEYEKNDSGISTFTAFLPFLILVVGFVLGFPIFLVGLVSGLATIFFAKISPKKGEAYMLEGVGKIATPIVATIGFLFMSAVIRNVGLVELIGKLMEPALKVSPLFVMWIVAALAGLLTQSYGASAAVVVPIFQVVVNAGADPLAAVIAAGGGASTMQYFLTGGPVAALATVIPVIPGSDLRLANKFQRPSILCGTLMALVVCFAVNAIK
ncbi:MAG: citrate transporter [Candidatus Accumulibacter sp.]|nr:citrate transporter [Accumulibacter sp.]